MLLPAYADYLTEQLLQAHCPERLLGYVISVGSLTAHLEALAMQPIRVQILSEGWQSIDKATQAKLGVHQAMAWVRTVLLYGDDDAPWICATSIFPIASLKGSLTRLKSLGNIPIGYVMFKRRRRVPHERRFYANDGQYGRQTIYHLDGQRILIDECFLTAFNLRIHADD